MYSLFFASALSIANASEGAPDVLEPSLKMLRDLQQNEIIGPFADRVDTPFVSVSIRFSEHPSPQQMLQWQQLGIEFSQRDGEFVHLGTMFFARVPWKVLDRFAAHALTKRIDLAKPLHAVAPLDVSLPEIQATTVNDRLGGGVGSRLTGKGVSVANFDTGVDVLHPTFFRADGGAYQWLDTDGDSQFTPGVDGVDLNQDGSINADEVLHVQDAEINNHVGSFHYGANTTFEADSDWLFLDSNGDGTRTAGVAAGYSDADAGFGEPIFIVEDSNANASLDDGERILMLGSSKVIASLNGFDGDENTLATNTIIETEVDIDGHGTSVSDIIIGGHSEHRRYSGVAPDADLIIANIYENTSHEEAIAWAEDLGADVMLHEISAFNGQYLDGSSNREVAVQTAHDNGISQICPAGNIGENYRHGSVNTVAGQGWQSYYFYSPEEMADYGSFYFFLTVLSQQALDDVDVVIRHSSGGQSDYLYMSHESSTECELDSYGNYLCSNTSLSDNGTTMQYGYVTRYVNLAYYTPTTGWWELWLRNNGSSDVFLDLWLTDDVTAFGGGVSFVDTPQVNAGYIGDATRSVASPATVPDCVGVASYSTRADTYAGDMTGGSYDLSFFSGRGPRIDGVSLLDIAAPGNYDIISAASADSGYVMGSYSMFGGTSAAGPHVAGAAALLLQDDPSRSPADVSLALTDGAATDGFTGSNLPNEEWGYGKLRIAESLQAADVTAPTTEALVFENPLLPGTDFVLLAPNETLAAEPTTTLTADGTAVNDSLIEVAYSWWVGFIGRENVAVTVDESTDLAGNQGQ